VDLGRGLGCAGSCEQAVRDLVATIDQSVRFRAVSGSLLGATRGLWLAIAIVGLLVGAFVLVWGLGLPAFREVSLLGLPFLFLGAVGLRLAWRVRAAPSDSPSESAS
jgi:hypothetical protein